MLRLSGLFSILLAVGSGALLFWASQSVQRAEKNLSEVKSYAATEQESLRVLSTEWDYLNRPERLEKLVSENLDLDDVDAQKKNILESVNQIPEPVAPVIPGRKPKNILQYVSAYKKDKRKAKKSSVIKTGEGKRFDALLNDAAQGGAR